MNDNSIQHHLSRLDNYAAFRKLVSQDKIFILPHKKLINIHRHFIYCMCGISMKYFERAYRKKRIVLEIVNSGVRLIHPVPWQDILNHFERE